MLYPSTDSSQTGFRWVVQGVRLGNVLSTFLYLVYNDDLLDELEKSNKGCKVGIIDCSCPSYVDDGALVASSLRNLQIMVNIAYIHVCKYHYEFHADKSCVVIFEKKKELSNSQFQFILVGRLFHKNSQLCISA